MPEHFVPRNQTDLLEHDPFGQVVELKLNTAQPLQAQGHAVQIGSLGDNSFNPQTRPY
jgi:hypothetical protein